MAGMIKINETSCLDIKYPLLHKQCLGFPHTALTESMVKFLSASGGQRGFTLFWPFLVFAASQISVLQNPLLFRRRQKTYFPSLCPGLSLSEQGRRAGGWSKTNASRAGWYLVTLGPSKQQRGAHCFTEAVAVCVRDRHPHFPASPQAAATALGRALPRAGGCLPQEQARAAALGSDWEWWLLCSWLSTPKSHLSEHVCRPWLWHWCQIPAARAASQPLPCLVLEVPSLRLSRSLEEPQLQAGRMGGGAVLAPSARTRELELFVFPAHSQTGHLQSPAAGASDWSGWDFSASGMIIA